jgi:hypothetical protein
VFVQAAQEPEVPQKPALQVQSAMLSEAETE